MDSLVLIGTGIAHVIMSEVGLYDINSGFLADVFRRDNAGISLEDGILGTERKNLDCRASLLSLFVRDTA
jgi:hypothetical protein